MIWLVVKPKVAPVDIPPSWAALRTAICVVVRAWIWPVPMIPIFAAVIPDSPAVDSVEMSPSPESAIRSAVFRAATWVAARLPSFVQKLSAETWAVVRAAICAAVSAFSFATVSIALRLVVVMAAIRAAAKPETPEVSNWVILLNTAISLLVRPPACAAVSTPASPAVKALTWLVDKPPMAAADRAAT